MALCVKMPRNKLTSRFLNQACPWTVFKTKLM